jgi:Mrp family chromosome partitioning ATPase
MACNHDCSSCSSKDCGEKKDFRVKQNERSNVKKVIAVVSGKGGVGKSFITSLLATATKNKGHKVAVLDADITGPSIPKVFGVKERAVCLDGKLLEPVLTSAGIKIMSINLLMEYEEQAVVWRGPVIAGAVTQFWGEVAWGDVDYMFVDMPPGTGDVPLTVFQSLPVDGIIVVTTPQSLVSMIVSKAINMANLMNVPILGIVENMSYLECPDCGKTINIFGESNVDEVAKNNGIKVLAKLPLTPNNTLLADGGNTDKINTEKVDSIVELIEKL